MSEYVEFMNRIVWGAPALILILGTGIFLSIRTGFAQLRFLPNAVRRFCGSFVVRDTGEGIPPFRALCTALAATVGTGNLVGVAGAICLGGPGAIFWMWICAIFGMITKFAEASLAVRFRTKISGEYVGGPMYIICKGLKPRWKWLASVYSFLGIFAAFGVGNATQINAVIDSADQALRFWGRQPDLWCNLTMGTVLAVVLGVMLFGGASRIGKAAERLVPFASGAYILLCIGALVLRRDRVFEAMSSIIYGAFAPGALTGGVVGSFFQTLRKGVSRGVFTNEAGLGTASIAHASANVPHPAEQGLMGIMEVFLDTIVICTLSALVILCSGVSVPYGTDIGGSLTVNAFVSIYGPWVSVFLAGALSCFAFATVLGWGLYGLRCAQFLFGSKSWTVFVFIQIGIAVLGSVVRTEIIWSLAETVNGLMAIPNLIALISLSGEIKKITCEYKKLCS